MSPLAVLLVLTSTLLHAAWNLLAHRHRSSSILFLQLQILIGVTGIGPVMLLHLSNHALPITVWVLATLSALCLCMYYLGLMMSYRSSDFVLVYPIARALPVLLLAVIDMLRGSYPSPQGWSGLSLVVVGCILVPQSSFKELKMRHYWNRSMAWILLSALGTCGYTTVDKLALQQLSHPGPLAAAQYGVLQFGLTAPFTFLALRMVRQRVVLKRKPSEWTWPAIAAALTFGAYWLVLCAYPLTPFTSYIVALRQFGIVIGVAGALLFFNERVGLLRSLAVLFLVAGVVLVSLSK